MPISSFVHTASPFTGADAADVTAGIDHLTTEVNRILDGTTGYEQFKLARQDKTIASGAITVTGSRAKVDTEAAAAADDLDTINGGVEGDMLILQAVSGARLVTVRHAAGNIRLGNAANFVLDGTNQLLLQHNGSTWTDVGSVGRVLLASSTLAAPAAALTISGIPQYYNRLFFTAELRSDVAAVASSALIQINGDSAASNYNNFYTYFNNTSTVVTPALGTLAGGYAIACAAGASASANRYGRLSMTIEHYAISGRQHSFRVEASVSGDNTAAQQFISICHAQHLVTTAKTSLTVVVSGGGNWVTGSRYALYGEM